MDSPSPAITFLPHPMLSWQYQPPLHSLFS
jgi:hypothetical protein